MVSTLGVVQTHTHDDLVFFWAKANHLTLDSDKSGLNCIVSVCDCLCFPCMYASSPELHPPLIAVGFLTLYSRMTTIVVINIGGTVITNDDYSRQGHYGLVSALYPAAT